jgi:energy-coupling factor transporter ATP-binding protein EcfA2
MWFEQFQFEQDPYSTLNPFEIPLERIRWNRDDLQDESKLERFTGDIKGGYRSGLAVYGPAGSGKTWLLRYLQKRLLEESGGGVAVIRGRVLKLEPTFAALYDTVVNSWNEQREAALAAMEDKYGRDLSQWKLGIGDSDLATCLHHLHYPQQDAKVEICEDWLRGKKIAPQDRRVAGISASLDSDYDRYLTLRKLLDVCLSASEACVLIVDELENAPPRFAAALGDSLRDLLDSFAERFGLVCSYTAQAADELLDFGFGEFLFSRLESLVRLDPIMPDSARAIFTIHHQAYRAQDYAGDELLPFTEDGLRTLINRMDEARWYPRFILQNCGTLGRAVASNEETQQIDTDFVDEQTRQYPARFQGLAPNPRLI